MAGLRQDLLAGEGHKLTVSTRGLFDGSVDDV